LKSILDLSPREIAIFTPLALVTLWMGVYPASFTHFFDASVNAMVANHVAALANHSTFAQATQVGATQIGNFR